MKRYGESTTSSSWWLCKHVHRVCLSHFGNCAEFAVDILKSIDVALGMIVVYLTFSLGVTALNESIAAVLSSRARWLRKGVTALLTPAPKHGEADATWAHAWAQIQSFLSSAPKNSPINQGNQSNASATSTDSVDSFYRSPYISALGQASGWQPRFAPSYIAPWTMLQGLLDAASGATGVALAKMDDVKAALSKLPERSPIRVALTDLITQADGNLDKLKALVDAWFKTFDEQVSAWYRQKTQHVLAGLSLLVALGMNLDTVAMFRALSADSKLRSTLVTQALETSKKPSADAVLSAEPLHKAQRALADAKEAGKPEPELKAAQDKVDAERLALEKAAKDLLNSVEATGLPLGWSQVNVNAFGFMDWLTKIVGLILSAFALSLGAPFWFDMLKKLASIRAVGKNPSERSENKPA